MPATLRSNCGGKFFTLEPGGLGPSLNLGGTHWDGDHTHPFSIAIEGVCFSSTALVALHDHIVRWADQPLERLVVEELNSEFHLAHHAHQRVQVRFGPRSDTISGLNPVVSVAFSFGTIRGEFYFVTDQSCLSIFAQELHGLTGLFEGSQPSPTL